MFFSTHVAAEESRLNLTKVTKNQIHHKVRVCIADRLEHKFYRKTTARMIKFLVNLV